MAGESPLWIFICQLNWKSNLNYIETMENSKSTSGIYVKKISTYTSGVKEDSLSYDPAYPQGRERVLVTFQSEPTGLDSIFAIQAKAGSKIGSLTIGKGINLDQAERMCPVGMDASATFKFGDKLNDDPLDLLHEVVRV